MALTLRKYEVIQGEQEGRKWETKGDVFLFGVTEGGGIKIY